MYGCNNRLIKLMAAFVFEGNVCVITELDAFIEHQK